MLPRRWPSNDNKEVIVKNLSAAEVASLREWVDYIPVQEVTEVAASANKYEDDGHMKVTTTIP